MTRTSEKRAPFFRVGFLPPFHATHIFFATLCGAVFCTVFAPLLQPTRKRGNLRPGDSVAVVPTAFTPFFTLFTHTMPTRVLEIVREEQVEEKQGRNGGQFTAKIAIFVAIKSFPHFSFYPIFVRSV